MEKSSYIIKFSDNNDYIKHKSIISTKSNYDVITTPNAIWVLHYLTIEEYEYIKYHGINITLDGRTIGLC